VLSAEAFQVFVSALGGTDTAVTTKNPNDLCLPCEEFEFAALHSKGSAFEMRPSVVDNEARKWLDSVTGGNLAVKRSICFLEQGAVEGRVTNSGLATRSLSQKQEIEELWGELARNLRRYARKR
jgi:hypothetical protein